LLTACVVVSRPSANRKEKVPRQEKVPGTAGGALSTAAFVLGSEQGLDMVGRVYGAEACAWIGDGLRQTGGFQNHVTDRAA
jgi:hypothetical protein